MTSAPAPARRIVAGPCSPAFQSHPHRPATVPSSVNVRTPAKRARGPAACPLHWRSIPTASPPSAATARFQTSAVVMRSHRLTAFGLPASDFASRTIEITMARGWESKSVEAQQDERERDKTPAPEVTDDEAARRARRQTLMLARTRALEDLQRACNPSHRAMLESAIRSLDEQIAAL